MRLPIKEKYVDEAVGIWIAMAELKNGDMVVDSEGATTREVFYGLPKAVALEVVRLQTEFRKKLYDVLCRDLDVSWNKHKPGSKPIGLLPTDYIDAKNVYDEVVENVSSGSVHWDYRTGQQAICAWRFAKAGR